MSKRNRKVRPAPMGDEVLYSVDPEVRAWIVKMADLGPPLPCAKSRRFVTWPDGALAVTKARPSDDDLVVAHYEGTLLVELVRRRDEAVEQFRSERVAMLAAAPVGGTA